MTAMFITHRKVKANVLSACLFAATTSLSSAIPSNAQDRMMINCIRRARLQEAAGDFENAGMAYFSILKNQIIENATVARSLPIGFAAAVGRRAVACLTINQSRLIKAQSNTAFLPGTSLSQSYDLMHTLEPNNPTWPYLKACYVIATGQYVEARLLLKQSLATTGGQSSVRQKATALLSHINAFANKDQDQLNAADRAALQLLLSGNALGGNIPYEKSSSSDSSDSKPASMSDGERRAQEAEYAGDSEAAARFRGGGSTCGDDAKYW